MPANSKSSAQPCVTLIPSTHLGGETLITTRLGMPALANRNPLAQKTHCRRAVVGARAPGVSPPEHHSPAFRFLAASTRLTKLVAETSSASQIRNNVSRVGDFRSRSSWLI